MQRTAAAKINAGQLEPDNPGAEEVTAVYLFSKAHFLLLSRLKSIGMPETTLQFKQLSDNELFELIRKDHPGAFEILYRRHWLRLTDIAFKRLQSLQKAEDLVQDLFISLYQKRFETEITVSVQAYLNQALKYKILNEYRSARTRMNYQDEAVSHPVCKNDLAETAETRELRLRIREIASLLPEKCRLVFALSRNLNLTNKAIALQLNISVSAVEKHIARALKIYRTHLEAYAF
jgi:RNA polymerase sigma-70 factor (family 1)